ncbi:MAG: CehA/McbA family metallohydrolase [Polyangiales bacterium]
MDLVQTPKRYLRAPRFRNVDGELFLDCLAWHPGDKDAPEAIVRWSLNASGEPQESRTLRRAAALMTHEGDALREARFVSDEGEVEITHNGGIAEVWLRAPTQLLIWRARGIASSPSLVASDDSLYVAWHHNVREDTGVADVAKWITLRCIRGEEVLEPSAPMTGRDRDLDGEEQSFEFPELVVGTDGALALFGRGSHNHWRQDLNASGYSERASLSDGQWGSRGRRCVAALVDAKTLVCARRDRRAIIVTTMDAPSGGAPSWTRAKVDCAAQPATAMEAREDPAARHGLQTCFGDIQQHSAHSDGIGSADEAYLRARDHYGDDFVALTDHESFLGKRTGPGEWEYLKSVADRFDSPGSFATLLAYEWTGKMYPGPGHKCVYVPKRDSPLISRDEVPNGREFVQLAVEHGMLASPHHIGWTGCDEDGHDPVGQPTWEICSCHGCYEHADHPLGQRGEHTHQLVDAMLAKGHRFGFTASSDSHGLLWHHGESRKRDPYRTGLTAVQVSSLNRDAVFEALKARRCYATSGAKILLDFTVDGHPMGSELGARRGRAEGSVRGTSELARVELVAQSGVVASAPLDRDSREADFAFDVEGLPYVYLRVVQSDGEMAWSSPVFFDAAGK